MAGIPFGSLLPQSGLPQSRPLNKQIGGRAGQAPAGRTRPLSPAERKRERTSGTHSLNVSHRPNETWTLGVALAPRGWGPASPARNAEQASKSSSVAFCFAESSQALAFMHKKPFLHKDVGRCCSLLACGDLIMRTARI